MLIVTAAWKSKQGEQAELAGHLKRMVTEVRKNEPGCLQYTLHQGFEDKTLFYFYERYTDRAAIDLHKKTPHFNKLIADTEGLIAEPVQVRIYHRN
ncbi:MAG: antibiotic biosynthesis monooxygenase [Deltaproteobacteria bacterium]|nr:antibiotic biosynthesis monooxygenase [Deltaproteobacteria bacterium]MBI4373883.1 antibiotic biosynthesis monooxygenase [Deltaproteobacteria bacterium]